MLVLPAREEDEEATSSWASISEAGMGKKMKSVVMVMSAVDLGH